MIKNKKKKIPIDLIRLLDIVIDDKGRSKYDFLKNILEIQWEIQR